MRRLIALLAMTWAIAANCAQAPIERLRITGNEFPETYSFSTVHLKIGLENVDKKLIVVDRIEPRKSGSVVKFESGDIIPGQTQYANIEIQTADSVGRTAYYFDVFEKASTEPVASFAVRGFVDWLVDPKDLTVDLGSIRIDEDFKRVIPISTRPGFDSLTLKSLESSSKSFNVRIVDAGRAFEISLVKDAKWGLFDEKVVLKTNSPIQTAVEARIRGQVRGGVIPSEDPVELGMVRLGESAERIIRLEGNPENQLEVGDLSFEGTPVELTKDKCADTSKGCALVRLRLLPMKDRGAIYGNLRVSLPALHNDLLVRYQGISIGKNTQVRDFAEDMKLAAKEEPSVSSMLKAGAQEKSILEAPMPQGDGPLITWQVLNERDVFGYEIYRSESGAAGSFSRLNEKIVGRLASDADSGSTYRWRDPSAVSGKTYWYYIGIVYLSGRKEAFTGPQKVVAK